jgi:hypothetical protein
LETDGLGFAWRLRHVLGLILQVLTHVPESLVDDELAVTSKIERHERTEVAMQKERMPSPIIKTVDQIGPADQHSWSGGTDQFLLIGETKLVHRAATLLRLGLSRLQVVRIQGVLDRK